MEGVMMRNNDRYAVAVRKPDQEIEIKVSEYTAAKKTGKLRRIPILRGVFGLIDSLYLGMSTLMFSASFFEDEEEKKTEKKPVREMTEKEKEKAEKKKKKEESVMLGGTVAFSIVLALLIFFVLPFGLSSLLHYLELSEIVIVLVEGILRLAIFIGYIAVISLNPEIKRVFMYHGAEHKCINCIEHGLELNVENVRKSSREHKRCGTSFLLIVMIVSIIFFLFIQVDSRILRLLLRLVLIPVIAGVSYEFIRLAGKYDNGFINALSRPGMWLQGLTTKEPDDDMIEVGIASVEAVFDWKNWQQENDV